MVRYTTGLLWSSSSLPLSAERAVTRLGSVGRGCPTPFSNGGGFSISWSCQFRPNRCMAVKLTKQRVQRGFTTVMLKDTKTCRTTYPGQPDTRTRQQPVWNTLVFFQYLLFVGFITLPWGGLYVSKAAIQLKEARQS